MSEWFLRYGFATVHPRLLMGAVPLDANDVAMLAGHGVDRILNLVQDVEYPEDARLEVEIALTAQGIEEQRVGVVDFGNLAAGALEDAVVQVLRWLEEGHTVYLHCRAGWQRSATVAAGAIAAAERIGVDEALQRLHARKPTAQPLPHQVEDLQRWWETRSSSAAEPSA
ncbi:MAG TPA: dual specificity protein phosphatase family protein [Solirubrobacteraceae bacterium]|nr:dual specificity protein phosphatase family protein [Solirubrobacteraceae bacterium]